MKKLILNITLFLGIALSVTAQNVYIPDATFKAYLVGNTAINTNKDTEIQISEAESFTGGIYFENGYYTYIDELVGIEAFINLTSLYCDHNHLKKLDISKNVALKSLDCQSNNLTSLDVSKNVNLTYINCDFNHTNVGGLNISNNLNLTRLNCKGNNLTNLDISNNNKLTILECDSNKLPNINIMNNTNLTYLNCINNLNLYCIQALKSQNKTNWYKDDKASYSEICNNQTGDFSNNAQFLTNLINSTFSTTNFVRGRNSTSACKTTAKDTNTIDAFYIFVANNSTTSIDLSVGNSTWLSTMELLDTLTYKPIDNTCQNNIGAGLSTRTYNFTGLTVGKKYLIRLELGDVAPLGHARMETVNNTFSVKLNSTVTDVSENSIQSNKTISNIYNLQGLEVSKDFRGLVIYKYSDGTTQKVVQE